MSKPHIIVLNDFGHVNGGAGKVALDSAVALSERGYNVTVLCCVAPVEKRLVNHAISVVCTGQKEIRSDPNRLRAFSQGIWNSRAAAALGEILDSSDRETTIVHAHGWTKALSSSCLHEAIKRRVKVVVTLHEYFVACPNGGFYDYQRQGICHKKPLSATCILTHCDTSSYAQKLWRVGRQSAQRNIAGVPSQIANFISVSHFSEQILLPHLPQNARVFQVPNPISTSKQPPVHISDNSRLIYVGRMAPEKGVLLLSRAAAHANSPITFVGTGIAQQIAMETCPQGEFKSWLPPSQVEEEMRRARALVFPSLWYETQGLVVLEAAALGLPSIVSDACAAREFVEDGETGLWFRNNDQHDLENKMRTMLTGDTAVRLGKNAYEKYWSHPFTMERHLLSLECCYNSLMDPSQPS